MVAFLGAGWGSAVSEALAGWPADAPEGGAPASPPAPVDVTWTVKGGPEGDLSVGRRYWADHEGEVRELTLTLTAEVARSVLAGDVSLSVAFMRGTLKTAGDPGAVVEVLEATSTPAFDAALGRLRTLTDR